MRKLYLRIRLLAVALLGTLPLAGEAGAISIGPGDSIDGDLNLSGSTSLTMTGGSIAGSLLLSDQATAFITGGTIGEFVIGSGDASVTISGRAFTVILDDQVTRVFAPPSAFPVLLDPGDCDSVVGCVIFGTLHSGDAMANFAHLQDSARIHLSYMVPEPSTAGLLAVGLLGLAAAAPRGRRRSRYPG
jgi:hypothetical protein